MPSYKMRVHLDYPTFDSLSEDRKSLINFIMENGAAYFRGEYDGNTLLHMAGTVRPTTRVLYGEYRTPEIGAMDLNIMYTQTVGTYSLSFKNGLENTVTVTLKDSVEDKDQYSLEIVMGEDTANWKLYKNDSMVIESSFADNLSAIQTALSAYVTIAPQDTTPLSSTTFDAGGLPKTSFVEVNPFDPSLLPDGGASIPHAEKKDEEGEIEESDIDELHYEDGIIDCNTVLCEANSNLTLYEVNTIEGEGDARSYWPKADVVVDGDNNPIIQIPVKLTPKIGDAVNTNPKIKPTFIVQKSTSVDGLHVCEMPIDKEGMEFVYDQQLRTQYFWLKFRDFAIQEELFKKVFYKVGILPINSDYTIDSIKEGLKLQSLIISVGNQGWHPVDYESGENPKGVKFTLLSLSDSGSDNTFNPTDVWVEQRLGSYNAGGIARYFVAPIENSNGNNVALLYFKLYEDTGTEVLPVDNIIDHEEFSLYDQDDPEGSSVTTLTLSILDINE